MKRIIVICIIICLLLSGCMLEKQDYTGLIMNNSSYQALVPVTSNDDSQKIDDTMGDNSSNQLNSNNNSEDLNKSDDNKADYINGEDGRSDDNTSNIDESDHLNKVSSDNSRSSDQGNEGLDQNLSKDNKQEKNGENNPDKSETKNQDAGETSSQDTSDSSSGNEKKSDDKKNSDDKKSSADDERYKVDPKKDGSFDLAKLNYDEDDFASLAPSTTMSFEELVGDNGIYEYPEGFPEPGTYRIVVDLYHQLVMAFSKDENGEYTVPVRFMLCSSGADSSQSPTGTFKMRNYRVRYALFNNTTSYAQYWSLITGRIYFHSILYTAKDASTYTESYKRLGTNVSHGCIRLTVPDARWIWFNCAPETVVEIRKGSKSEKKLGKIRDKMILASYPSERIKLKKGKIPMTDNWTIEEVPHEVGFVNGSQ
ncbi:MAG: L,D-transpeptidase family protein [Lachnospiraceae bacterium]|nr:L,D-transpeptidase family protein [Lachnospiraceae bacterium]